MLCAPAVPRNRYFALRRRRRIFQVRGGEARKRQVLLRSFFLPRAGPAGSGWCRRVEPGSGPPTCAGWRVLCPVSRKWGMMAIGSFEPVPTPAPTMNAVEEPTPVGPFRGQKQANTPAGPVRSRPRGRTSRSLTAGRSGGGLERICTVLGTGLQREQWLRRGVWA